MSPEPDDHRPPAVRDLDAAVCSAGAPSARNLLVTVFGDVVAPIGLDTEVSVQALAAVLGGFGVNERLVRTSLSRLVGDELLTVRSAGRRSAYRIAPGAIDLFATADIQIYRGRPAPWDGRWTVVVLDGAESTADRRAALRTELVAVGFGVVAPNVLASPIVTPEVAAGVVHRLGGFEQVLLMRTDIVPGDGLADPRALARRCIDLDEFEQRYAELADRFEAFDADSLATLDAARATKLRLLVVATFRRLALTDPMLPRELLPEDWAGDRARREAARLYDAVVARSDAHLAGLLARPIATPTPRFTPA